MDYTQGGGPVSPTTMKTFTSGAKSTKKMPRFDLIPLRSLELNAGRFEYGAVRHGERNYRKGGEDPEFVTDRVNHLIRHAMAFAEHRRTSDLAAILCNASILADIQADTKKDGADGCLGLSPTGGLGEVLGGATSAGTAGVSPVVGKASDLGYR